MATIISDNFNRADSNTVGNGWTEFESSAGIVSIVSNKLSINTNGDTIGHAGVVQSHGTLVLPASIQATIIPNGANSAGRPAFLTFYNDGTNPNTNRTGGGLGLLFKPNKNNAGSTFIFSDGANLTSVTYNFTVTVYVWIDITANGSNCDVKVYLNTSNTKPGSATLSATNTAIPTGTYAGIGADGDVSDFSFYIDDYSLTDSSSVSSPTTNPAFLMNFM